MENILVVDDEPAIRDSLAQILTEEEYNVTTASCGEEALENLGQLDVDVVLLDLNLPDVHGFEVLQRAREIDPDVLVIIVTGFVSVESAVEAIKLGAYDYITKPFEAEVIKLIIRLALETQNLKHEVKVLKRRLGSPLPFNIVAESQQMRAALSQAADVAVHEGATVLITGESGTGKEVIARSIHSISPRREKPFLEINCATLPENLLESELFGHEKGAFTDAVSRKKGLFEAAEGGTVFLDEIGEMPIQLQAKLLGVIERHSFRRVGGNRNIAADIRIVAATNIDPLTAIAERKFREDLYYRLSVFPIHLAPLRERPADIVALAKFFLLQFTEKFNKQFRDIDPNVLKHLQQYPWPGNVRELKNVFERICIMFDAPVLTDTHLPSELVRHIHSATFIEIPENIFDIELVVDEVTSKLVRRAMEKTGGNIARAARLLGIPRGTLRYRLKKYRIVGY